MAAHDSELIGVPLSAESGVGDLTLGGFLSEAAERHGDREAIVYRDASGARQRWTYSTLYEDCVKVARALLAAGVSKDARIGVLMTNRPEWILSIFGAALAGAVGVALNTFSTRRELEHELTLANVEMVLLESSVTSHDFLQDLTDLCPELQESKPGKIFSNKLPYLRRIVTLGDTNGLSAVESWDAFVSRHEEIPADLVAATSAAVSPIDAALIFFSSGSTAMPKGIPQSHRAAALQCWRFGRWFEIDSDVRCWSANGFFWSGNFAMALGGTLGVGGCLVLQCYFDPDETLQILESERISQAIAWPHQEARLQECPGWATADLSALKYVDSDSVLGKHPSVDTNWRNPAGYGMTETFTFVTGLASSLSDGGNHGEVLPGNTLRIVDPLSGEIVPSGEIGEIIVKGPTLTRGYLKMNPEDIFDDEGFIHTGDEGYITETGQLFWKGRLSEIIKTGGANVSPIEIDTVLGEHQDLKAAFTVGVPHDTLGEMVVSCVVIRDRQQVDEKMIQDYLRQNLASFKVPRRVLFFGEDDLPMTGSNKIRRSELKDIAVARLNDQA